MGLKVKSKLLDSIVEITNQRDSDALGTSIVATIAELLPSCHTVLYQVDRMPIEKYHPKIILDNADKALYYAKENGRDCLYNYEVLLGSGKVHAVIEEGDIELFLADYT